MWPSENKVADRLKTLGWKIKGIEHWNYKTPCPDFIIHRNGFKKVIEVKTIQKNSKDRVIYYHRNFDFMIVIVKSSYYIIPVSRISGNKSYLHLRDYLEYKNGFALLNFNLEKVEV